jgi:hypothetical protein
VAVSQSQDAREALERIVDDQIDDTLAPSQRYVHFQEKLRLHDDVRARVREAQRRYEYRLAEIIARGQDEGSVVDGDPRLLAMILIGAIGRTARWYSAGGRVGEHEFRRVLKRFALAGLFARPPSGDPPFGTPA